MSWERGSQPLDLEFGQILAFVFLLTQILSLINKYYLFFYSFFFKYK